MDAPAPVPPPEAPPAPPVRRGRWRRLCLRALSWSLALAALLLFAGVLVLRSEAVRELLRERLVRDLSARLERPVSLDELSFQLLPPRLELRRLALAGAGEGAPPLVEVERLRLWPRLGELGQGRWSLSRVELLRPRLHLQVGPDGELDLPRLGGGEGGQLHLDSLLLEEGSLVVEGLELPIDLNARDLRLHLVNQGAGELRGQLASEQLELRLPGSDEPYPVALLASGRLSGRQLELASLQLHGEQLRLTARGQLAWGPGPGPTTSPDPDAEPDTDAAAGGQGRLRLQLAIDSDTTLLTRLGYSDLGLAGPFTSQGQLRWRPSGWSYSGQAQAPQLQLDDWQVTEVRAQVSASAQRLRFDVEGGRYAQGEVAGRVELFLDQPRQPLEIDLTVREVDFARLLADRQLPLAALGGRLAGRIFYRSLKGERSRGNGEGQLYLRPTPAAERPPGELALEGLVPLQIAAGVVISPSLTLSSEHQRLLASGSTDLLGRRSDYTFRLSSDTVGELLPALAPLWAEPEPPSWFPRDGRGVITGELRLAPDAGDPASGLHMQGLNLRLELSQVTAPELAADRLSGSVELSRRRLEHLRLEAGYGRGALLATGWADFAPARGEVGMELTFDAVDWPLANVRSWRELDVPLTGNLSGRLVLSRRDDEVAGRLTDARAEPVTVLGLPLHQLRGDLDWDARRLHFDRLVLTSEAGALTVEGELRFAGDALDLRVAGRDLALSGAPLNTLFGDRLDGRLDLEGTVSGTVAQPGGELRLTSRKVAVIGQPLEGEPAEARLRLTEGHLEASGSLLGLVDFEGGGYLDRQRADLSFAVRSQSLATFTELAVGRPSRRLTGALAGTLTAHADAAHNQPLHWRLQLDQVAGRYRELAFVQLEPMLLELTADRLAVRSLYLGEVAAEPELAGSAGDERGEIFLTGSLQLAGDVPVDLQVQSTLSTRWLRLLNPDFDLPGQFDLLARLRGPASQPRLEGQGQMRLLPFVWPLSPQSVEGLVADLVFESDRMSVERMTARLGGGTLELRGDLRLASAEKPIDYRFYATARDVKLLYPEGWVQRGNAELWLVSTTGGRLVQGDVQLEELRYLAPLGMTMAEAAQRLLAPQRIEVVRADDWLTTTQLGIAIRGPGALRVHNREANLRGDVDLELRGDLARPVLLGNVELEPGGTLVYASNEYQLERGLLTFANPYVLEPTIDLRARSRVRNFAVTLDVSGTPERLDARVTSDPPLPDLDVIRLMTNGRSEGDLDAEAFLAGQAASAVSERVNNLFGLDTFRVDPLLQGSDSDSTVRFTVGKRLSKDWFITYSRDPSTTEEDILAAEWQLTPQMVLVFSQNGDGSFSVDARWETQF